jgi:hypothetical protein
MKIEQLVQSERQRKPEFTGRAVPRGTVSTMNPTLPDRISLTAKYLGRQQIFDRNSVNLFYK